MRITVIAIVLLLAACGEPQPPLVASDVHITRPLPGRHVSAGYLVLSNTTSKDIRITRVTSPEFGKVQIHETKIEDGVARMQALEELVVPAHGSVKLESGGKHLMLMRPDEIEDSVSLQLYSGDAPVLTIHFDFGGN